MRECKNHEGYYDPTASEAMKKASKYKFHTKEVKKNALTYRLGEVPGFINVTKAIKTKR